MTSPTGLSNERGLGERAAFDDGTHRHGHQTDDDRQRLAITVRGVVQGVGFRPFVYNAARILNLTGWVQNRTDARARSRSRGTPTNVDAFVDRIRTRHPPQARIERIESAARCLPRGGGSERGEFQIRASGSGSGPAARRSPPTWPRARVPGRDPRRRPSGARYPFTNCTNCGPRWSIIEQLPYDRPRTSMAAFAMCPDCGPSTRRSGRPPVPRPADRLPRVWTALELLDRTGPTNGPRADEALAQAADADPERAGSWR